MTRSTTVTVLVPDCLRIDIEMAFSPSSRVWLRTSSFASVMRATSPRVMTEPFCEASTIFWKSRDVAQPPHRAHRELGRAGDEAAAGNLGVLPVHRAGDLRDRQPVGVDPVGIQQDPDFAPAVAEERDFADVLDRLEHLLDLGVGDLGDLLRRALREHDQRQDRSGVGIDLADHRRLGVAREAHRRHLVADVLGRRFDVALEHEGDGAVAVALVRAAAQLVDAVDGVDRGFDRPGDGGFDLLGAGARQAGPDVDRRANRCAASGRGRARHTRTIRAR